MADTALDALPKAQVRVPPGATTLTVSLVLAGKQRNLNRPKDEPLQKALFRLRNSIAPATGNKKAKRKQRSEAPDATASTSVDEGDASVVSALYQDGAGMQLIPETTANEDAWPAGALLVVGQERFQVVLNLPYTERVVLPRRPMAGFPVLPNAALEFADPADTQWTWYRRPAGTADWAPVANTQLYIPTAQDVGCTLKVVCTPGARRPGHGSSAGSDLLTGDPVEAISDPVEPAPQRHAAMVRCPHTPGPVPAPGFRILSYNLLADQYAASEYAQKVLFNYCPLPCLDQDYRRQLILAELTGYNADVMCLQEVDAKLFTEYLVPLLGRQGYAGHFTNKQGKVREGSATFWRTSRFHRLLSMDIKLRDVFKPPLAAAHAQWAPMLDASPELVRALQKVTTVAQATVLVPVVAEGSASGAGEAVPPLCVVNTHLFFHPYAPHIRTMHTAAILEEAQALLARLSSAHGPPASGAEGPTGALAATLPTTRAGDGAVVVDSAALTEEANSRGLLGDVAQTLQGQRPTLLFCGDLNSDLNDGVPGVVELLQQGALKADHWDWRMGANFKWGMNEEDGDAAQQASAPQPPGSAIAAAVAAAKAAGAPQDAPEPAACAISVVGIDVQLPCPALRSADDLATPFTNYTSGYKALLDYVWYEPERLQVTAACPVPTETDLGSYIPSPSFPSDHLAVVYDLRPRA